MSALPMFIGRERDMQTFKDLFRQKERHKPLVLYYYGVEGIGKSSFKGVLDAYLQGSHLSNTSTVLNYHKDKFTDRNAGIWALRYLRKELGEKVSIPFHLFDIGYVHYMNEIESVSEANLRKDLNYWGVASTVTDILKNGLEVVKQGISLKTQLISAGASLITGDSLAFLLASGSLSLQLINLLREINQHQKPTITADELQLLEDYINVDSSDDYKLFRRLLYLLTYDINNYLTSKSVESLTIFVDSYDRLIDAATHPERVDERDEWLRLLIAFLPDVVWVIFGTDRKEWLYPRELSNESESLPIKDIAWDQPIAVHNIPLKVLADISVGIYLDTFIKGASLQNLRDYLLEELGGYPWLLDHWTQRWNQLTKKGKHPTAVDFVLTEGEHEKVINLFLQAHSNRPARNALEVLSVLDSWNEQIFEQLVKEFANNYPSQGCSQLVRGFCFIDNHEGQYIIPKRLRRSLTALKGEDYVKRVKQYLSDMGDS